MSRFALISAIVCLLITVFFPAASSAAGNSADSSTSPDTGDLDWVWVTMGADAYEFLRLEPATVGRAVAPKVLDSHNGVVVTQLPVKQLAAQASLPTPPTMKPQRR